MSWGAKTSYAIPVPGTKNLETPNDLLNLRVTWDVLERVRKNARDILEERFIAHGIGYRSGDSAIRMLDPVRDLEMVHGWSLPVLVEGENLPMIWHVPVTCVVLINGVMYASDDPAITRCRLSVGDTGFAARGDYTLEPMWALNSQFAILAEPVFYNPRETMHVTVWSREDRPAGERFGLFGMIIEPLGRTVTL